MTYKDLLEDPSFPHWGRQAILLAWSTDRDPVDVVNVLEAIVDAAKADLPLASVATAPRDERGEVPGLMF